MLAAALLCGPPGAAAATATAQAGKAAKPAAAAKASGTAAKDAPRSKTGSRKAAPAPTPVAMLPVAGEAQLAAAEMALRGSYDCEFGQTVEVRPHTATAGYLDVKLGPTVWVMKPVLSSTGALRLEDVRSRMLMLQIANKSMLMDTQVGRRVVDDCVHPQQLQASRDAKAAGDASGPILGSAPAPAGSASGPSAGGAPASAAAAASVPAADTGTGSGTGLAAGTGTGSGVTAAPTTPAVPPAAPVGLNGAPLPPQPVAPSATAPLAPMSPMSPITPTLSAPSPAPVPPSAPAPGGASSPAAGSGR